jgi:hypothetical protein
MVVHTCNPNYIGGFDKEDHGPRPAQDKIGRSYLNKKLKQKRLEVWLKKCKSLSSNSSTVNKTNC